MKYSVEITAKAEGDVESVLQWFRNQSAEAAPRRWLAQLLRRIATLERHPTRCARAVESDMLETEIREIGFGRRTGRYRILFRIQGQRVDILRVWHSARDAITRADL